MDPTPTDGPRGHASAPAATPRARRAGRPTHGEVLLLAAFLLLLSPWARTAFEPNPSGTATAPVGALAELPPALAEISEVESLLAQRAPGIDAAQRRDLAGTIVEASRAHSLPLALVLAVIEVESGFDPVAVSSAGAIGLMQILPATGADVARRLGLPWQGARTLRDPEANVRIGTAYLRELVERYASVRVALAAYNWGPGNLEARRLQGRSLPVQYARRVLASYSVQEADS